MTQNNITTSVVDKELKFHSEIITDHRSVIWTIQNFSLCPTDVDEYLQSPEFTTGSTSSVAVWTVRIYPKGQTEFNSIGKVGLFVHKKSSETETHDVRYKICLKDVYRRDRYVVQSEQLFKGNGTSWGRGSVVDRDLLLGEKRDELLDNDTLRVYCEITVGSIDLNVSKGDKNSKDAVPLLPPTISCLEALSSDLKTLYETQKCSDFTLQTPDRSFPVHKNLLSARSTVFSAMLDHDTQEQQSNNVFIPDIESDILDDMLSYLYSGKVRVLETDRVIGLFSAADKYDLEELRTACKKFLLDNVSVDSVCDVAVVADLYDDADLKEATRRFFANNASYVLSTPRWEELLTDRPHTASQLLEVIASGCSKGNFDKT